MLTLDAWVLAAVTKEVGIAGNGGGGASVGVEEDEDGLLDSQPPSSIPSARM